MNEKKDLYYYFHLVRSHQLGFSQNHPSNERDNLGSLEELCSSKIRTIHSEGTKVETWKLALLKMISLYTKKAMKSLQGMAGFGYFKFSTGLG
jgi:hypothetical protein